MAKEAWTWRNIPESNTKEYLQRTQTSSLGPGDDDLNQTRKRPGLGNITEVLWCTIIKLCGWTGQEGDKDSPE